MDIVLNSFKVLMMLSSYFSVTIFLLRFGNFSIVGSDMIIFPILISVNIGICFRLFIQI